MRNGAGRALRPLGRVRFAPIGLTPVIAMLVVMDPVLLIFAGLAAFVIFRLISVLGTRTGHEQRHDIEGVQRARSSDAAAPNEEPQAVDPDVVDDAGGDAVSDAGRTLLAADASFNEVQFLKGARSAYEMIVEAFAAGDLKSIRRYLADPVYEAFRQAVNDRETNEQRVDLKFVGIDKAAIADSAVDDRTLSAVVEFSSNQVRAVYDKNAELVDGDPNRIDLVKDRWTFEHDLKSRDPNWILVATGGTA